MNINMVCAEFKISHFVSHPRVELRLSGRQIRGLIKLHNEIVRLTKLICHRQEYKSIIILYFRVSFNPHQNYKST
jgi:hypothetical protein